MLFRKQIKILLTEILNAVWGVSHDTDDFFEALKEVIEELEGSR
jgi:hypothetical protein